MCVFLMMQNVPVLEMDIDKHIYKILEPDLMPYKLRSVIKEIDWSGDFSEDEIKEKHNIAFKNQVAITQYLSQRMLGLNRENAKKILNAFHFSQSQDDITRAKNVVACKAVSVIDDYWICEDLDKISWDQINIRNTSLNDIVASIALSGSSLAITGIPHTPEITAQGVYAKAWIREGEDLWLHKKSTNNGNESDIEVSVSTILDCFNVPHVKYIKSNFENNETCKCLNMCSDDLSILPAEDFYFYCNRSEKDFMTEALKIDAENIYKLCVVDYLISNSDRHMQNWGFYVNNSNGNIVCCHPAYDHNNAFDECDMKSKHGGDSLILVGRTKKEAAEYAINKCDFHCVKPVEKEMFLTTAMYESFMNRACELGIYEKKEKSFLKKLVGKEDEYVPKKVGIDDTNAYYEKLCKKK